MTEAELIAAQVAREKRNLRRDLSLIARKGFATSQKRADALWFAGYIEDCGPDENCPYNHYRLTEVGKAIFS